MNYKNLLTIPLTLFSMSTLSFATIYSNGEDGSIGSWNVYDNSPSGATVSNVFDNSKNSKVIELKGKARFNAYMLGNRSWGNSTEKNLRWSMKFSEKFKITVYLSTNLGKRTIFYNYKESDKGLYKKKYIKLGLGEESKNGTWQSFSRNIEADLKKYDPNNSLISIKGFKVQGSGRIDDVELFNSDNVSILEISNIKSKNISKTDVKISWSLNHKATGQIEYGLTSNYGNFSKKENSFTYDTHTQNLKNLKENTSYHYRVISEDINGNKIISKDQTFSTSDLNPNSCITRNELLNKINKNEDVTEANTSCIKDMSKLFYKNETFNQKIGNWDVSNVTNMSHMFFKAYSFNQNIGKWDVSNVTDMDSMFTHNRRFNQDIGNWDVSKVKNMSHMFHNNRRFNQNIGNWDVSNVSDMSWMFYNTENFNQKIEKWDVSNVKTMSSMFRSSIFNQDVESWNLSSLEDISYMFASSIFNQNLGKLDTSNINTMQGLFSRSIFNKNIENWDVSNVKNMESMFYFSKFNQNIGNWNVSNVKNMRDMFEYSKFNLNISNWDVSNVNNMTGMFASSIFNQDISKWDVSNVNIMYTMFNASAFNQNISDWDVSNVSAINFMFYNAKSFSNHDLSRWDVSKVNSWAHSQFLKNAGKNNIPPKWKK